MGVSSSRSGLISVIGSAFREGGKDDSRAGASWDWDALLAQNVFEREDVLLQGCDAAPQLGVLPLARLVENPKAIVEGVLELRTRRVLPAKVGQEAGDDSGDGADEADPDHA